MTSYPVIDAIFLFSQSVTEFVGPNTSSSPAFQSVISPSTDTVVDPAGAKAVNLVLVVLGATPFNLRSAVTANTLLPTSSYSVIIKKFPSFPPVKIISNWPVYGRTVSTPPIF